MRNELTALTKIKEIILDINPQDILKDASDYGLNVKNIEDFSNQTHNHIFIEKLMNKYAKLAAGYCAASGASSGFGGIFTTVALTGVDIANMAAQLYRLNQKLAILSGFDPQNIIHQEKAQIIYLKALGFDAAARAAISTQVVKAAAENVTKKGPSSNAAIRLIMEAAKLLGLKMSKNQAAKLIPVAGAILGGGLNYIFAKNAAKSMVSEYKSDYFDRWQAKSRQI